LSFFFKIHTITRNTITVYHPVDWSNSYIYCDATTWKIHQSGLTQSRVINRTITKKRLGERALILARAARFSRFIHIVILVPDTQCNSMPGTADSQLSRNFGESPNALESTEYVVSVVLKAHVNVEISEFSN